MHVLLSYIQSILSVLPFSNIKEEILVTWGNVALTSLVFSIFVVVLPYISIYLFPRVFWVGVFSSCPGLANPVLLRMVWPPSNITKWLSSASGWVLRVFGFASVWAPVPPRWGLFVWLSLCANLYLNVCVWMWVEVWVGMSGWVDGCECLPTYVNDMY